MDEDWTVALWVAWAGIAILIPLGLVILNWLSTPFIAPLYCVAASFVFGLLTLCRPRQRGGYIDLDFVPAIAMLGTCMTSAMVLGCAGLIRAFIIFRKRKPA